MAATLPAVQSPPAPQDFGATQDFDATHDFEAIEAAVMETARGRWFLAEYARRMRAAETAKLLEAVTRIERTLLASGQEQLATQQPTLQQQEQPAALAGPEISAAVAAVQERLSEIAWNLRERGFDERACTQIEAQSRALRNLMEARGLALAEEAEVDTAALAHDPDDASDDEMPEPMEIPPVAVARQLEPRIISLAAIDALDDRARARLFY
jgi:hypothetical protein